MRTASNVTRFSARIKDGLDPNACVAARKRCRSRSRASHGDPHPLSYTRRTTAFRRHEEKGPPAGGSGGPWVVVRVETITAVYPAAVSDFRSTLVKFLFTGSHAPIVGGTVVSAMGGKRTLADSLLERSKRTLLPSHWSHFRPAKKLSSSVCRDVSVLRKSDFRCVRAVLWPIAALTARLSSECPARSRSGYLPFTWRQAEHLLVVRSKATRLRQRIVDADESGRPVRHQEPSPVHQRVSGHGGRAYEGCAPPRRQDSNGRTRERWLAPNADHPLHYCNGAALP